MVRQNKFFELLWLPIMICNQKSSKILQVPHAQQQNQGTQVACYRPGKFLPPCQCTTDNDHLQHLQWRRQPQTPQYLPKGNLLVSRAQGLNRRVVRCANIIPIDTNMTLLSGTLQHFDFKPIRWVLPSWRHWHVLTFLIMIFAFFGSISMLCMSVHAVNPSAWFPQPSASSVHQVSVQLGELGHFVLFWGMLMSLRVLATIFMLDR